MSITSLGSSSYVPNVLKQVTQLPLDTTLLLYQGLDFVVTWSSPNDPITAPVVNPKSDGTEFYLA